MAVDASAIVARGLRKSYGPVRALDGVDLDVRHGEVFALLGPNGAGKTTLVEILEGYRARGAGEASVLGVDPARADGAWRARIGIVLQSTAIFEELTVEEVVAHFASFYPAPRAVGEVIEMAGLVEKRRVRCKRLSGGQRRRVDLALGLIGDPELIFLDEPTTGFDPAARRHAWDVVRNLTALDKTVLLTTHYLDEAEALADRVGVILAGKLVEVATPRELGGRANGMARVSFSTDGPLAGAALPELTGSVTVDEGMTTVVTARPTAAVAELAAWCRARGLDEIPELSVTRPSLEDIYLEMVARAEAVDRLSEAQDG